MSIFSTRIPIRADGMADGGVQGLQEHRDSRRAIASDDLLGLIRASGLHGFGGARFPVARKWDAALRSGGRGFVVANGAESEPASSKDSALLQLRPHLVLDGLSAAARATNAVQGVVWLHQGAWHARTAIERALAERRAAGLSEVPILIADGPARYLSGESSAIVSALSGGPALPRMSATPAASAGIGGRPTVVHNVETLARVALIEAGHPPSAAQLLTITTPESKVVVEAAPEDRLAGLASGQHVMPISAALLGGYGGRWHRWESIAAVRLAELGGPVSAGIVLALPQGACGVALTARIIDFLAASSAKQCGPCIFGLHQIAEVMDRVAAGRARRSDVARLQQISATTAGRGACHHPDGAIGMLASAIDVFGHEFAAHRRSQHCRKSHFFAAPGGRAA